MLKLLKKTGPHIFTRPKPLAGSYIYALVLTDHPGVVKIGRAVEWSKRRRAYSDWNLRDGDGIADERVFDISHEYIDLKKVEADILAQAPWPVRHKREWFVADLDDVCRLIDRVLTEGDITYDLLTR